MPNRPSLKLPLDSFGAQREPQAAQKRPSEPQELLRDPKIVHVGVLDSHVTDLWFSRYVSLVLTLRAPGPGGACFGPLNSHVTGRFAPQDDRNHCFYTVKLIKNQIAKWFQHAFRLVPEEAQGAPRIPQRPQHPPKILPQTFSQASHGPPECRKEAIFTGSYNV